MKEKRNIILAGGIIGIISVILVALGNPKNMGLCIACFIRDTAGGIGLHGADKLQYIRPEVIGLILGALIAATLTKEFSAKGGSSPLTRFLLGVMVMIGGLIFLGCPTRMILRLAGGDLNAIVGLVGFAAGIGVGIVCLNKGFSLKRAYKQPKLEGWSFSGLQLGLLALLLCAPTFIKFSVEGPGSQHAPAIVALGLSIVAGIALQRTRMCMAGGIRDFIMFKDTYLISGFIAIFVFCLAGNLVMGNFNLGFAEQPIAHMDGLWNFIGMAITGWGAILLGGCPMRQLVLAGEGNTDSAITVVGLLVGAAICHNFGLASSAAGPTGAGKIAGIICLVLLAVISVMNLERE